MGSSTQTSTNRPLAFQENYLKDVVVPFATNISETPFTPFEGDRVAGTSGLQEQALSGYGSLDMGGAAYKEAGDVFSGLAGRTPEDQAAQVAQYQGQFTQGVIDPTLAAMERQRAKDIVGEQSQITGANAFGNARRDVFQGERAGEYDARMGQTLAGLQQQGLQYGTQRAAAEDALRMQAAGQVAGTAGSALQSQMAGLGSQLTAGAIPQGIDQAKLDAMYEQYMLQQQYPLTQLTALTGGAAVLPSYPGTTTGTSGGMGNTLAALGSLGQGIGAMRFGPGCWVAREVYGVNDPKWLEFREWLFDWAPAWFRSAYLKYGERVAAVIRKAPFLKAVIRPFMDAKRKSIGYEG